MPEWRCLLRRMARCGLLSVVGPQEVPPYLVAGAFAAPKSAVKDRLIGDRRPQNSQEGSIADPNLPYVWDLLRLHLQRTFLQPDHQLLCGIVHGIAAGS